MGEVLSINKYAYDPSVVGSHKYFVPVKPINVVYTQFEHVSGVAARQGQNGVTVSKARILDTLINQLVSSKNQKLAEKAPNVEQNAEKMDTLIEQYQTELKITMQKAQVTGYALAGSSPDVGVLFSIDV